jgi:hypothetical protein
MLGASAPAIEPGGVNFLTRDFLECHRSENFIRADMAELWPRGYICRLGGRDLIVG